MRLSEGGYEEALERYDRSSSPPAWADQRPHRETARLIGIAPQHPAAKMKRYGLSGLGEDD